MKIQALSGSNWNLHFYQHLQTKKLVNSRNFIKDINTKTPGTWAFAVLITPIQL
jgi:hypothetical protein